MSEQKKATPAKKSEEEAQPAAEGKTFDADLDELLETIDDVLEENAAEFVSNYIQKGGQ